MSDLLQELLGQEHRVWQALILGDPAADMALLSPDFLGVYPDGYAGRADHGAQLASGPTVRSYEISEARIVSAGTNHALLVYRASYVRPGISEPEAMYVSSLWQRQGAGWINTFSQDTPATGERLP